MLLSIDIFCVVDDIGEDGKVIDFGEISKQIKNELAEKELNEILKLPTLELLAKHICDIVPNCYKSNVQDIKGRNAIYIKPSNGKKKRMNY